MEFLKNIFKNKYLRIILIVAFFCAVVISRRIDMITYPQFYAEDGVFWYSEAYSAENPLEPFLVPKQRYFQTVSRVGGFFGSLVDIGQAPLVYNLIAIMFGVLPALFFLSARFEKLMPKFSRRFLCSLSYLLLLGTAEIHANLTNVQWRLALLMFLVIIAPRSKQMGWKIFDGAALLLAGLSGPFVFFALPVALAYFYFKKSFRNSMDKVMVLGVTFLIQLYSFFFIPTDAIRSKEILGASLANFFKILSGNIFIRGILGPDYVRKITKLDFWQNGYLPVLLGIVGILLLGYVFWKAELELKLLIAFAFMVFLAALASPQVSLVKPQWEVMRGGSGGRYYFLPTVAWVISLGWLFFRARNKPLKFFAGTLLAILIFVGLLKDWVFKRYKNYNFDRQVVEFKKAPIGQSYTFKIVPKWNMTLEKK